MRKAVLSWIFSLAVAQACASDDSTMPCIGRTTWLAPNIYTLRLTVEDDPSRLPIINLDKDERLEISFDDLTHEYRRFTYRIEHCDFAGNNSEALFDTDYVSATAEETVIEDYETSDNTTVLYTHYSFTLPNTDVRPKLSGNYRLTISMENDEGDLEVAARTYFGVLGQKVFIYPSLTTNTEIDRNASHQQLSLQIDMGSLNLRDADREIWTLVMQNHRLDNAVVNPRPTSQTGSKLFWEHDRELIFPAGNEFRKYECMSTRYPGLHAESMRWFDPFYHCTLMTDRPKRNYIYDEDRNGLFVVRADGSGDEDIEADYVVTHFTLDTLPSEGRDIYVWGRWATEGLTEKYKMKFDPKREVYEAALLLKTGYYNYQYLTTEASAPGVGETKYTEGDFFQAENEYSVLVYYCPLGGRYWQLVGLASPTFKIK